MNKFAAILLIIFIHSLTGCTFVTYDEPTPEIADIEADMELAKQRRDAEAQRLAEEERVKAAKKKAEEKARLEKEKQRLAKEERVKAAKKKAEEKARLEKEKQRLAEEERVKAAKKKADELAKEKAKRDAEDELSRKKGEKLEAERVILERTHQATMVINALARFKSLYKVSTDDWFKELEKNFKNQSYTPPKQEFDKLKKEYEAYRAIAKAEAELKELEEKHTDISDILNEAQKNGLNSLDDVTGDYKKNPTLFKWENTDYYYEFENQELLSKELEKIDAAIKAHTQENLAAASAKVDAAIEPLNTELKKLDEDASKDLKEWVLSDKSIRIKRPPEI